MGRRYTNPTMSKPLWVCAECGRTFANRNQTHTCAPARELEAHFAGRPPQVRALFDAFADRVRACGPVSVIPEKTRIAFHVRMSFAVVTPRRDGLVGHFVLARRVEHPRFVKVETFSRRNHVHVFRLGDVSELDDEFQAWIAEAYAVGEQKHLAS